MEDEIQIKVERPLEDADNSTTNSELLIEDDQPLGEENFEMECSLNDYEATNKLLECGARVSDLIPSKRTRRSDAIIFSPPFFALHEILANGRISAKCLSCGRLVRGYKNVSSNYIQHMKNIHPDKLKIYESRKWGYGRAKLATQKTTNHSANSTITGSSDSNSIEGGNFTSESMMYGNNANQQQPQQQQQQRESGTIWSAESTNKDTTNKSLPSADNREAQFDLSAKTIEAMSKLLDTKLKAFVTRNELTETRENLKNLLERRPSTPASDAGVTTCTDYSHIDASLKAELEALQNECKELRAQMALSRQSKRQLQREIQLLDRNIRQKKLVVHNLPMVNDQLGYQAVDNMLKNRLGLPDIHPQKVTLLAGRNCTKNLYNFLVEFPLPSDVKTILSNVGKLKNTGIFIEPDMSFLARKRKDKLMTLRRELLRRRSDLSVFVRGVELIVANKKFTWDDVEGLCYEDGGGAMNSQNALESLDAVNQLKLATNLDMREFINFLQHYEIQMH